MTAAIRTYDLTKYYGRARGIEGLDLEVAQGEVFGFLGPNGAGKTTTIRLLLNLLRPSRGRAEVLGMDAQRDSLTIRRRLGYIPGGVALYRDMTGAELLSLVARGRGGGERQGELCSRLGLDPGPKVKTLSTGNKQKLAIALAFLPDPELYILDEPALGLDPLVQREFYHMLREEQGRGKTVFLSSHYLAEVERVCQRVGIVREGGLVAVEEVAVLKRKKVRRMEVSFASPLPAGALVLPGVEVLHQQGNQAELAVHGGVAELLSRLAGLGVEDLVFPEASLEDTFMKFYGQGDKG